MSRMIVGVLRGGTSSEYPLSLKTGAAMLAALPEEKYEARDIFIDRRGLWHLRGAPTTPARALSQIDVVLNALHGGVGEDGTVARLLEGAAVPYAGSRGLSSALALNKIRARSIMRQAGISMPRGASFSIEMEATTADMARAVFAQFGPPYVVKPSSEGASEGVMLALTLNDLPEALADTLERYGAAVVEEYILGREASVGLIEKFRNQELYALPPSRVHLPQGARLVSHDFHAHELLRHEAPGDFSFEEKDALMQAARKAHQALGLSHFSRMDFIVAPHSSKPRVYLLEANAIPGLYPGASFPTMLESVGSSIPEFLEHSIALARSAA